VFDSKSVSDDNRLNMLDAFFYSTELSVGLLLCW
jgi:hypothetical protein